MNNSEIDKYPGETFWEKLSYIAQHGTFAEIVELRKLCASQKPVKEGGSYDTKDPQDMPDMALFSLLRWRFKMAPSLSDKNIDELLGMHADSPCAKCKHSSTRDTCPGYAGNPMWGSLRCNCDARREKIAAEAKAEARRMWEENHGAWATYEEFLKAMPGIEKDDVYASENIGRQQYWEGEPCEYFEPIDEA
jgi:hypothetical protein